MPTTIIKGEILGISTNGPFGYTTKRNNVGVEMTNGQTTLTNAFNALRDDLTTLIVAEVGGAGNVNNVTVPKLDITVTVVTP